MVKSFQQKLLNDPEIEKVLEQYPGLRQRCKRIYDVMTGGEEDRMSVGRTADSQEKQRRKRGQTQLLKEMEAGDAEGWSALQALLERFENDP